MPRCSTKERTKAARSRIWSQPVWGWLHKHLDIPETDAGPCFRTSKSSSGRFHHECCLCFLHGHFLESQIPGEAIAGTHIDSFFKPIRQFSLFFIFLRSEYRVLSDLPLCSSKCLQKVINLQLLLIARCDMQVIAGVIEERGIEAFLAGNPRICNLLSFVVRTGNTYLGSLFW